MKRFSFKKFLFLLALIVIPLTVYTLSIFANGTTSKDPIKDAIVKSTTNPIEEIAKETILKQDGDYAIYIKNLKTNEGYEYNENKIFKSASLYKLWVMAVAYEGISNGRLDLNDVLRGDVRNFDVVLEIASESADISPTPEKSEEEKKAEDEKNSVSYSLENAIEQMITFSNNYAALLVASRAGNANVQSFLKSNYSQSSFGSPPKTTAKDIGIFYEDLYNGKIVSALYSREMINILKRQELNDRIPKYLPEKIDIAHKTGELGGNKHDAGIVFSPNGDYIIVVMTDTNNPSNAAEEIALFSKEIYDYFN